MTPLKRVVDFVMDKGGSGGSEHGENLKDTNRRLQNVVEEMLTKNMYLQQVREKERERAASPLFLSIYNCSWLSNDSVIVEYSMAL